MAILVLFFRCFFSLSLSQLLLSHVFGMVPDAVDHLLRRQFALADPVHRSEQREPEREKRPQ